MLLQYRPNNIVIRGGSTETMRYNNILYYNILLYYRCCLILGILHNVKVPIYNNLRYGNISYYYIMIRTTSIPNSL